MSTRPVHLLKSRCLPQVSCGATGMVRTLLVALFVLLLQNGRAQATCGDYLLHIPREIRVDGVVMFESPGDAESMPAHPKRSPCANGECRPAPAPTPQSPTLPVRDRGEASLVLDAGPRDARCSGWLTLCRAVRPLDGAPLSIERPPRRISAL